MRTSRSSGQVLEHAEQFDLQNKVFTNLIRLKSNALDQSRRLNQSIKLVDLDQWNRFIETSRLSMI